ncbi:MAG: hypothetical protein CVV34_00375, partial [Methanomicrobiales archaeon HGW-Methanomicrobiales-5]
MYEIGPGPVRLKFHHSICTCIALLLIFAALIAPVSAAIPVADFTSNVTKGVAPLAVQFNDSSTNNPDCWNWSFGDGTTWVNTTNAALKNASHIYTTKGWYNVTLIANNTDGSNRMVKTQYVNAAAGGMSNTTDFSGITIAPSGTPEPILNRSSLNGPLVVTGDYANVTNPSPSFSSAVFHYQG